MDDLFQGYETVRIATRSGAIHVRIGGAGSPLLLLHGYPETGTMWHKVAPLLADRFRLVIPDLPGYGQSDVPATDARNTPYTKRAMAAVMVEVMAALGHERFAVAGHDRGGRVAYRMALDTPQHVERLATLDILPGYEYWARMNREYALRIYHWVFLAQPFPVPETLICPNSDAYYRSTLASWTRAKTLEGFDPRAVEQYLSALRDPARVRAACEDYRAGAYADVDHDAADLAAGRKIAAPLLALWCGSGVGAAAGSTLETWRKWAVDVRGEEIDSGHFLCEENPRATAVALRDFFG